METVVVAFEGEKNGRRLKELLESSGTAACLLCRTADQVKRLVRQQRLTAVVCGYKFPDGTAEELAGELPGFCTVLLLAPRGLLELVPERPGLLRLPAPAGRRELLAAVEELLRLGEEAGALLPPRRSREEREVVERAKERLMARNGMTEEEAHRALRRRSMDCRIPLADAARMLLDAEYKAIPEAAETYISLETVLSLEPDFVYGRSSSFSEKNNTTHDTLSGYGIMSLSSIEGYTVGADVDVVYQDFYDLGRIFQVEDRAEEIVSAMKEQIAAVEEAVAGAEPVKVFVYDMAQEGGAYTCGDNFTAKLISHAGGVNIFEDMDTTWATVSWEEVVERAPEVIVINDYGSTSLEEKIEELKENPALADVPAIRDGRITSVTLCESFASSMTGDTIEKFARSFHPDCFQ